MKKISRRSFLAVCGTLAAATALTACGGKQLQHCFFCSSRQLRGCFR